MRPSRSYLDLVCATPRSGSTLFCKDLLNTGLAGQPQDYFETNAIEPLTIVYEDFVPTQEETIASVLNYLDIEVPETHMFKPRHMRRQADELSEAWVQSYLQTNRKPT